MATPNGRKPAGRTPKPGWQRITKTQLAAAVELAAEGLNRQQITEQLKLPRGALRARLRFDPLFEADFEAARRQGYEPKAESLLGRMWEIAHSDHPSAMRACDRLLMLYSQEWREAHKTGISVSADDGKLEVVLAYREAPTDGTA